jgi:hypothetical protein
MTEITQTPPSEARPVTTPTWSPLPVVAPLLYVHATAHRDLEQLRVASEQRLRILTKAEPDKDGVTRGFGLDERHPDVARLVALTDGLKGLEHDAELGLKRSLRGCSIHPWIVTQIGLGEKQTARLLAAIGDPYINSSTDKPRTVSALWAYCGLHVIDGESARRKKGVQANWSTEAKTRAYLCSISCIKHSTSPYREVYLKRREHTLLTHEDWTPGHSHNDALRITSKEILKRMWREARRLHGEV